MGNYGQRFLEGLVMDFARAQLSHLVVAVLCLAAVVYGDSAQLPQVTAVFDITRSDKEDVVYFRNKDVLRGQVLNDGITVATQYGIFSVPLRRCAGVSFEGARTNTEAIVTVNFNRITGIVTDPTINFRIGSSGTEIPIRKEKIRFVLLKKTPDETDFLKEYEKADLFIMANGDVLSGETLERKVEIRTDYGKVPVAFSEMQVIQLQGGENVTAVITKTNGDTMRGTLETEEISLDLDIGLQVPAIYKDKFAKVLVDQASKQAAVQFGIQQPVAGESDGVLPIEGVPPSEKTITLDLGKKVIMKLVLIPAGKFLMGSPENEAGRDENEGPQREVTISKPFYIGIYEVTQEQYEAVIGSNPSEFKGAAKPVENVSWDNAMEFCKRLSQKTGKTITLPTEGQWEYACRAGSKTRFSFGDDEKQLDYYAWYTSNSSEATHPVGQKKPNAFGLYDMHGNASEWCSYWYAGSYVNGQEKNPTGPNSGTYRVFRGGGWDDYASGCRVAGRSSGTPGDSDINLGFRCVLDFWAR
jgi:formylglycine-generating enzyme required for sulfatase activity